MLRARHLFSDFDSLLAISLARNPFFFSFLAVIIPRPPVPRGSHPAV